jgi:hypothetical protein
MGKDRFLPSYDTRRWRRRAGQQMPCPPDPQWPAMPGYEHCFRDEPRSLPACPPTLCEPVPSELAHCVGRPGTVVLPGGHPDCGFRVPDPRGGRGASGALGRGFDRGESIPRLPGKRPRDFELDDDGRTVRRVAKTATIELAFRLIGACEVYVWFKGITLSYAFLPTAGLVPGIGPAPGTPSGLTTQAQGNAKVGDGYAQPAIYTYLDGYGNKSASPNGSLIGSGKAVAWTERVVSVPVDVSLAGLPFAVKSMYVHTAKYFGLGSGVQAGSNFAGAPDVISVLANLPTLTATATSTIHLTSCVNCGWARSSLWPLPQHASMWTVTVVVSDVA